VKLGAYLRENVARFSKPKQVHVFATTFNVFKQMPPIDLQMWLGRDASALPHLIAVGLQEAEDYFGILTGAYSMCDAWLERIEANLPSGYQALAFVKLSGILLALFYRTSAPISDIQSATKATGLMGFMGNKGGVALSLRIYDNSICFVNCHLDAGRNPEAAQARNRQFHLISSTRFPNGASILDHDVVIWMGDLNYRLRIPTSPSIISVISSCSSDQYLSLLEYDELRQQKNRRLAFEGFHEGAIRFRPTYRYLVGEQQWNLERIPAWCDRILWWKRRGVGAVRQVDYSSVPEVTFSDHKPVCSRLVLTCTQVDWEGREEVVREFKNGTAHNDCSHVFCCHH